MVHIRLSGSEKYRHFFYWFVITLFLVLISSIDPTLPREIISTVLVMLTYASVYYINFLYLFPLYKRNKLKLGLYLFLVLILYIILNRAISLTIYPEATNKIAEYKLFINLTLIFCIITAISGASFQNRLMLYDLEKKERTEKNLLTNEIFYLKNQFNPKTTLKFLEYCSKNIDADLNKSGEFFKLFTEMYNYTINTNPEDSVTLIDEINYIQHYIKLSKLLNDKVNSSFLVEGDAENIKLSPRLFITLVENAFKYGDSGSKTFPITIKLVVSESKIFFFIKNSKLKRINQISTGVGLMNLKNQLDLFYNNKYELKIIEDNNYYEVTLILRL